MSPNGQPKQNNEKKPEMKPKTRELFSLRPKDQKQPFDIECEGVDDSLHNNISRISIVLPDTSNSNDQKPDLAENTNTIKLDEDNFIQKSQTNEEDSNRSILSVQHKRTTSKQEQKQLEKEEQRKKQKEKEEQQRKKQQEKDEQQRKKQQEKDEQQRKKQQEKEEQQRKKQQEKEDKLRKQQKKDEQKPQKPALGSQQQMGLSNQDDDTKKLEHLFDFTDEDPQSKPKPRILTNLFRKLRTQRSKRIKQKLL